MAERDSQVEIEELALREYGLDGTLLNAFTECELRNPQFGVDWLSNLSFHSLAEHEQAVVFVARTAPDNFVALPMKLDLRSGHTHALGNFYTSAYCPVINSDNPERLFLALFQHLASNPRITGLTLSPMERDTPCFSQIQESVEQAGWKGIHRYFCFGNWIHELDGASYQSYLATRPSQLRNTITRRTRKFLAEDRGKLELVREGHLLEESIRQFVAVYNESWKQEEPYPDFIPHLVRLAASRGWLRLGIASYDNVPIASQIWLVSNNTAYIFKLAYHEKFKQLSPGTVLSAFMMEHVIDEDAVSKIDFLSGDDSYKEDWMSVRSECFGIAAINPLSLRGKVMLLVHNLKNLAKKFQTGPSSANRPLDKF